MNKDEIISNLKAENEKLKAMLEQTVKDIEFLGKNFGCCGCLSTKNSKDCPFYGGKVDECTEDYIRLDEINLLLNKTARTAGTVTDGKEK